MKALLDEQFSAQIAVVLRDRGLDVAAISENADWIGMRDPQVVELARAQERAIVTNNVADFRPLAATALAAGTGHAGMIFVARSIPRRRADIGLLVDALAALMHARPQGLVDEERWLTP